jgi:hypothetical protein
VAQEQQEENAFFGCQAWEEIGGIVVQIVCK